MINDIRNAVRGLTKHPGFTAIAVLTLALGIGANSAIFSVVNSVLLRPLPYQNSDRLVMVWGNFQKLGIEHLTAKVAEYENYRAQERVFEQVGAFENQNLNLTGIEQAERVSGARVTANLFTLLGAQPLLGRGITAESSLDKVAVISNGLWQRRFGGQPNAIGQSVRLDDSDYTVIGVMPEEFQFPHASFPFAQPADVWLPLTYTSEQVAERRGPYRLNVIGLLKTGVTLENAQAEMSVLGHSFETSYRGYRGPQGEDGGWQITVAPLREEIVRNSRRALWLLFGAVTLVLLIACANVANLLLVRATLKRRELAVRAALGASRWRIARALLIESLLLATLGGSLGFVIAQWGVDSLGKLQAGNLPRLQEIHVDGRVLAFTALLTIFTALIFGVMPAWQAAKVDLQRALRDKRAAAIGDWRNHFWRNLLLVGEVALSLVLLVGAGLLVNSFLRLQHVQPAIATDSVLSVEIDLSESHYPDSAHTSLFLSQLLARVEALPGVQAATVGTARPLSGVTRNDPFSIEGRPLDPSNITFAGWQMVGANYFGALNIPLIQGRDLTLADMDVKSPVVAVINESMSRRYWPGENPIGRHITLGLPRPDNPWITIIGIAKDLPHGAIDSAPAPDWYLSRPSAVQRHQILLVRIAGHPSELAASIRATVASIDRDQPITSMSSLTDVISATVAPRKFNMMLFTLFAALAVGLAALGIYGVMTYSVTQRTREVGIRMALGAQKNEVLGLILRKGMTITMIGVVVGLGIAMALTRLMTTLLFGVTATDTSTFVAVSVFVMLIALLACYLPARRATRVDPLVALREE